MLIRTPPAWGIDTIRDALASIGSASPEAHFGPRGAAGTTPVVRRINMADLRQALARGIDDFSANRTDVVFLGVIYAVAGLLLAALAAGRGALHLIFPLASGFALIGPLAAIGLYEMSRRREAGRPVTWLDGLAVLRSPAIGQIALLGAALLLVLAAWLVVASLIYDATLGPQPPASLPAFAAAMTGTTAGLTMAALGVAAGAVFAAAVFTLTVVAFPLMLDRHVDVAVAVSTSLRVVAVNPGPMLAWAAIVAGGLVLGSLPLLVGLAVVLPVLGHATWHLYRAVVAD